MLREDEVREALKFSQYTTALKSHVKEWLKELGMPDDDESAMNAIMQKTMIYYHDCVSSNFEWLVETADKLIKEVYNGRNTFWELRTESNTTGDRLDPAVYLLLLLGPIGWIIFFYMYYKNRKNRKK